jgi:outer membrane autotransporter protein
MLRMPVGPSVPGRSVLLAGTALATTLILATLVAPMPALAVACTQPPPPGAISDTETTFITCINTDARADASQVIVLSTSTNPGSYIDLANSGALTSSGGIGINVQTAADDSPVTIVNAGTINAGQLGIFTATVYTNSDISITNTADIVAQAGVAIQAQAIGTYSDIAIVNSGDLTTAGSIARSIFVQAMGDHDSVAIDNTGSIMATATGNAGGIYAYAAGADSQLAITNRGDVSATSSAGNATAIFARSGTGGSDIAISNYGELVANSATSRARGIYADSGSDIAIENYGSIVAIGADAAGIAARLRREYSQIAIENVGSITVDATSNAEGIQARADRAHSDIFILNEGDISASSSTGTASGIATSAEEQRSYTKITNLGTIAATGGVKSYGITAYSYAPSSDIVIVNAGTVTATGGTSNGVHALTNGRGSDIVVQNYGRIEAKSTGVDLEANSGAALLQNYGQVVGGDLGVLISGDSQAGIINHGSITADSLYAIKLVPGSGYGDQGSIVNFGSITGFVKVFGQGGYDQFAFINEKGGVFEARGTSIMGGGDFFNQEGATVHTAGDPTVVETTTLSGLYSFQNKGLISLQDGAPGDTLVLTSGPYSHSFGYNYDISFIGSGKSTLAVDAFLGGPGSTSDVLIVNGNVSGKTKVQVNDTNPGPGVLNKQGIPVVYVNGATPNGNEFFLPQPIDTGFFEYDLFFRPTGSGVFELKSFLGQGAFVLPQLITAAQDMWHSGSSTWFDRTADLRVLLNGGAAPAEDPEAKYAEGTPSPQNFTPAVWARGAGNWLSRDDSENVTAYGSDYRYNLNRDLETIDFQSGIDLGKRGLFSDNDILVFGALGGFIHSDLDYDAINRLFNFEGGQVGGYATYLRGGLFVDTLVNVHLMQVNTRTLGFPNSMNATTVGVRTDSGYRFGSFHGGAFIEPLATISATWADIDGFTLGGNRVSFNDDAAVQGRLGLRVGTSTQLWTGITAEPFVIGSVWGNLSNDNQATLVSTGTTFHLEDKLQDVWGEVSGGVNFFNPTANTSVFAKLDVTFGDNIDGVGGKAGMRVSW